MGNSFFIHEDDFDQIELVPEQNYIRAFNEIDSLPEHKGEAFGFNNIIIRNKQLISVEELQIPATELKANLASICLNFFDKVKTGHGAYSKTEKNVVAFGFERLGLIVESDKSIITNLYLVQSTSFITKETCDHLLTALHVLGQRFNLILIDWNAEELVRLTDVNAIKYYLSDIFEFQID